MKYNSKGALVCSVVSMLMLGSAAISVAWLATQGKLTSSVDDNWACSTLDSLWHSSDVGDRGKGEQMRGVYDAEFVKVVADYPELKPEWKKIPDAENGFLAWLEFLEKHAADGITAGDAKLELPAEVAAIIRKPRERAGTLSRAPKSYSSKPRSIRRAGERTKLWPIAAVR